MARADSRELMDADWADETIGIETFLAVTAQLFLLRDVLLEPRSRVPGERGEYRAARLSESMGRAVFQTAARMARTG